MMQAVILAAGKSTRTYPLTINIPKPLLRIIDKTILEHNLDQLKGIVDEVIIIVGFKKEMIMKRIGLRYKGMKISYVIQKEINGTGGAISLAEEMIKDRFIVLNGDDIYSRKDIRRCICRRYCLMGMKVKNPSDWGILTLEGRLIKKLAEKPKKSSSDIANIGCYLFDKKIFEYNLKKTKRGEYEITDYVKRLIKDKIKLYCEIVEDYWLPVGYPWKYIEANAFFLKRIRTAIKGKVEKGVVMKGQVYVGKGSIIRSGSYIEGPAYIGENCTIGPMAYLRPDTIIFDNCRIRAEVIDSVIMENSTAKHHSYIGHSVIGKNCNIAAGTVTADYRHDAKENHSVVGGKKVNSGRRKLGAFFGDNVRTGINTSVYPGRKIWPDKTTLPGEVVKKDIIS